MSLNNRLWWSCCKELKAWLYDEWAYVRKLCTEKCKSGDFEAVAAGSHYAHSVGQQKQQLGSGSSRTSLAHTSCYLDCLIPVKWAPLVLRGIFKHSSYTEKEGCLYLKRPLITSKWPACSSNVEHVTSHLSHLTGMSEALHKFHVNRSHP